MTRRSAPNHHPGTPVDPLAAPNEPLKITTVTRKTSFLLFWPPLGPPKCPQEPPKDPNKAHKTPTEPFDASKWS